MASLNPSILRLRTPALAGVAAIAVCAAPLASAASAGAATRPAATAGSPSLITFNVNQPAGTAMHVEFTGGLGSITEQEILGSSLLGDTTTPSSFSINAQDANSATDFVHADTTAGTPITGTATLRREQPPPPRSTAARRSRSPTARSRSQSQVASAAHRPRSPASTWHRKRPAPAPGSGSTGSRPPDQKRARS
jgi:hypothetical protein